jgi:hypothetical protein
MVTVDADPVKYRRHGGHAALCRDFGKPLDTEFRIRAGIGTLVSRPGGQQWTPAVAPSQDPPAPPRPAAVSVALARRAICASCDSQIDGRCQPAGCACAGLGLPDLWASRCPLGRWPEASP